MSVELANQYCELLGIDPDSIELTAEGESKSIDIIVSQFESGELTPEHLSQIRNKQDKQNARHNLTDNLGALADRNQREYLISKIVLALVENESPNPSHVAALKRAVQVVESSGLVRGADMSETDPLPTPQPQESSLEIAEPVQLTGQVVNVQVAKAEDGSSFSATWDAVDGATGYEISWKSASGTEWTTIKDITTNSWTVETAKLPNDKITFAVIAVNELGRSKNPEGQDNWSADTTF